MAFMCTTLTSSYPLTNNQLETSSNPMNQVDMQGRQTQSYVGNFSNGNDHIARKCTQPTKVQNSAWFKEKMLLAQVQEAGIALSKEQLVILADTGDRVDSLLGAYSLTTNPIFQPDGIDLYDSDCDDISTAKAVLMVNLLSYGSDVLSEVPHSETYQNDMANQSVQAIFLVTNFTPNTDQSATSPVKIEAPRELPKVFNEEFIPFKNSLQTLVKDFKNGLLNELNEVKTMFNQMEAAVDQCSIDKKLFEIEKKELKLENERLLEYIICQDVVNIVMDVDDKSVNVLPVQNTFLDDNIALDVMKMENGRLMQLLVSQDLVHTVVNSLAAINDYKSMERSYIKEYERNLKLAAELSQMNELSKTCSRLEQRLLKLDLEPLSPKLKNNKEAHVDYIRIIKENADTLRDIVEQARTTNPLDNALAYACMYTKQIQELLVYVSDTCPSSPSRSEKLVAFYIKEILGDITQRDIKEILGDTTQIDIKEILGDTTQIDIKEILGDTTQIDIEEILGDTTQIDIEEILGDTTQIDIKEILGDTTQIDIKEILGGYTKSYLSDELGDINQIDIKEILGDTTQMDIIEILGDITQIDIFILHIEQSIAALMGYREGSGGWIEMKRPLMGGDVERLGAE
ncbi:hypothetical protein Tco_0595683 [Tanacetum coccineum]